MLPTIQLLKVMLVITGGIQAVGALGIPHTDGSVASIDKRADESPSVVWDGEPRCEDVKAKDGSTPRSAAYCALANRDSNALEEDVKVTEGTIASATRVNVTLREPDSSPELKETVIYDFRITSEFMHSGNWNTNSNKLWPALLDLAFSKQGTRPQDPKNVIVQDKDEPLANLDRDLYLLTGKEIIFRSKFNPYPNPNWDDKKLWNYLQNANDRPTIIQAYSFPEAKILALNRSYTVKETKIDGADKKVILWDPAESKDTEYKYIDIKDEILSIAYYKDSV